MVKPNFCRPTISHKFNIATELHQSFLSLLDIKSQKIKLVLIVMNNGKSTEYFKLKRGTRQGTQYPRKIENSHLNEWSHPTRYVRPVEKGRSVISRKWATFSLGHFTPCCEFSLLPLCADRFCFSLEARRSLKRTTAFAHLRAGLYPRAFGPVVILGPLVLWMEMKSPSPPINAD